MKKLLLSIALWLLPLTALAQAGAGGGNAGAPGVAAGSSLLSGCVYNASAPTAASGQQMGLQCDTNGNLKFSGTITATNPSVGATGAAVPASATYLGITVGGNLTGWNGAITIGSGGVASGAYASGSIASGALAAGAIVDIGTGSSPAANTVNSNLKTINTTLGSPMQASGGTVGIVPVTSGGASHFSAIVANNTTSVAIKASAGQLYGISAFNNSATIAYLKLYDAAQGSTTCGSGTPVERFMIPASGGFVKEITEGDAFATAITYCVTTGIADADTGAPAASAYIVNALYK